LYVYVDNHFYKKCGVYFSGREELNTSNMCIIYRSGSPWLGKLFGMTAGKDLKICIFS